MKLTPQQVRGFLVIAGTSLASLGVGFIVGRTLGINEMWSLYGDALSAEASHYLAVKNSEKDQD